MSPENYQYQFSPLQTGNDRKPRDVRSRRLRSHFHLLLILSLLVLSSWACSLTSGNKSTTPTAAAPGEGTSSSNQAGSSNQPSVEKGPGPFDLASTVTGLDGLIAYQAILKMNFDGTVLGSPATWNKTYSLSVSQERQARILSIASDGLLDGWLSGQADGLIYNRAVASAPCGADFANSDNLSEVVELASMLPPVNGAEEVSGSETLAGLSVQHYRFDERAIGMDGIGSAQGEVWVAKEGGFVVKYTLQVQSNQGIYDSDQVGSMTWDYKLSSINQPFEISLPQDCPAWVENMPLPDDANIVSQVPGYLSFTSAETIADIVSFYQKNLADAGFQPVGDPIQTDTEANLEFARGNRNLTVQVKAGDPTTVALIMENGELQVVSVPTPTVEATSAAASDLATRINNSLSLAIGSSSTPSVFPSFHIEIVQSIPSLDSGSGKLVVNSSQIVADVAAGNIHLTDKETPQGGSSQVTEGYLIGDKNYLVSDGQVQEDIFGVQMTWLTWPLSVFQPLAMAGMGPGDHTSVELDSRPADQYTVDSANADPNALEMLKGMLPMNPETTAAHGTIWLDKETGALLKLVLDYDATAKDSSGNTIGSASGHLEITISQIGKVTVTLP